MKTNAIRPTRFYPVDVTVLPGPRPGKYDVVCNPPSLTIDHENSVILYMLTGAPEGVEFWSLDVTPSPQVQFRPPLIGAQGRMLTLDDIDREKQPQIFHVTLLLTDPIGSEFAHDPQIINRPG